ncbi:MAG TPA: hypothetical protein ENH46_06940 [Candidatus Pacearchaeota archaeon]|nr:hypothetical protein [Candidatus Pacearchaeota archaeon]
MKMNAKNMLVSFQAIVIALLLVATVSAFTVTGDLANIDVVKIDGVKANGNDIAVEAGDTVSVKVYFNSLVNASDVRVKAEIEGDKVDVEDRTSSFDVEDGKRYSKTLTLKIPYELKDVLSDDLDLSIKVWNGDYKSEIEDITLRVQRPTYNADVKSVNTPQAVEAGDKIPVDVVLKNMGYNDLDDVYVTASISALGIERTSYFGDLVAIECNKDSSAEENYGVDIDRKCDEDDEDTVSGRLYLEVPFGSEEGIYTLEVEVTNDDTSTTIVKQIVISNDFADNVIVTSSSASASAGENAEYSLLIVNPTNKLKVYRVVSGSSDDLSTSVDDSVIAVTAGSSKTVKVTASSSVEGEYDFTVDVISGDEIVGTVNLALTVEGGSSVNSPIVILTVILAIIFLVLLVVLIVLIGKKPEKSEEFGESYY